MAFSRLLFCIFLILLFCHLLSAAYSTRYFLPLAKDSRKNQFYTKFFVGTPPVRVHQVVDLTSEYSWFTCDIVGYNKSSTWNVVPCDSHCTAGCSVACSGPAIPTTSCTNKSCGGYATTPWINYLFGTGLITDTISLYSSEIPTATATATATAPAASLPKFPFLCTFKDVLKGLSSHAKGVLSLARTPTSLHAHVSSSLHAPRKFAVCPPSGASFSGAMFFGGGPYILPPNHSDLSKSFITTALVANPHKTDPLSGQGDASIKYFINLRSINIDGTPLKFNTTLLSINKVGSGGTTISTMDPYTVLHSQIYKPLINLFISKAESYNLTKVAPVSPFGAACFRSSSIHYNVKSGKGLPVINLVLNDGKNVKWSIYGSNSMVRVSSDVHCLGVVDGGDARITPIAIGAHQLEDNLVEFDFEANKLRFTSSLLRLGTSCSQLKGL